MFLKITESENRRYMGGEIYNAIKMNWLGSVPVNCAFPDDVPKMYRVGKLGFVPSETPCNQVENL